MPLSKKSKCTNQAILKAIESGAKDTLESLITGTTPSALAPILYNLDNQTRNQLWSELSTSNPQLCAVLLEHLSEGQQIDLIQSLEVKYSREFLPFVGSWRRRILLSQIPPKHRAQIISTIATVWNDREQAAIKYDDHVAGGISKTEIIKVESYATIQDVHGVLESHEQDLDHLEWRYVYIQDSEGLYVGSFKILDVFKYDPADLVIAHLDTNVPHVLPSMDFIQLKRTLDDSLYPVIPVVTSTGFQIGVVGHRQLNEKLYLESERKLMENAGIFGGDEFRNLSTFSRTTKRMVFLIPSIGLSYAAVSIIAVYEPTIEQLAVLAAILPLVANLSGAAGNQSVAVSIRELSVGMVTPKNLMYVALKDVPIGIINGFVIGIIIGLLAISLDDDEGKFILGIVVGLAYMISSTLSVLIGCILPLLLKRFNLDPAMLSSPILTTLSDAISFFSVLYLIQNILL
jgi:magnesium transporter